jgi:TonB family protein
MNPLVDSTIKASLVVVLGLAASTLLRRRSAALRHWVLAVSIACSAAMPLLAIVVPTWHVHLGDLGHLQSIAPPVAPRTISVGEVRNAVVASESAIERRSLPALNGQVLAAVWIAGMAMSLGVLLVGFVRLLSIASRSERLVQGKWVELAVDISRAYRLRRPVLLLTTDHPTMLVTWGTTRPKVILPTAARGWAEDRIRVVLSHELAHVRRGDWLVQIVAEALRAIYWFNPLVWMACRRLRQNSEQACDDAVLSLGIDAADYATHLVDLARVFNERRRVWLRAPSVARPSSLEGRIRAMLNAGLNRRPLTQPVRLATVSALLGLTVAIAGVGMSAQTASATYSGFVVDATGAGVPGVTVTLAHAGQPVLSPGKPVNIRFSKANVRDVLSFFAKPTGLNISYDAGVPDRVINVELDGVTSQQALDDIMATSQLSYNVMDERSIRVFSDPKNAKHEARTDAAGYFQLTDLPAGSYVLQIRQAGFASLLDTVALSEGQALQRTIAMQVGSLQETVTVIDRDYPEIPAISTLTPPSRSKPCTGSGGGHISPPTRIRDVRPQYPHSAGDTGIEGRAVVQARIGIDGFVKEVRSLSPVEPNMANAAIAAVSQWQFTPTLLNCVPVEVDMTVTVNFRSGH